MAEFKFPIDIGDTLHSYFKEPDGVISVRPLKVNGVAQIGETQYAIGPDGEMHEIGSLMAMIPEGKANTNESKAAIQLRKIANGVREISHEAITADNSHLYKQGQYDIIAKVYDLLDNLEKGEKE